MRTIFLVVADMRAVPNLAITLSFFFMFRSLSCRSPVADQCLRPGVYHISYQEIGAKTFGAFQTAKPWIRTGFVCDRHLSVPTEDQLLLLLVSA